MEQVHKSPIPSISGSVLKIDHRDLTQPSGSQGSIEWDRKDTRPRPSRTVTFTGATIIRITRDSKGDGCDDCADEREDCEKGNGNIVEPSTRTSFYGKVAAIVFLNLVAASLVLVFVLSKKH